MSGKKRGEGHSVTKGTTKHTLKESDFVRLVQIELSILKVDHEYHTRVRAKIPSTWKRHEMYFVMFWYVTEVCRNVFIRLC